MCLQGKAQATIQMIFIYKIVIESFFLSHILCTFSECKEPIDILGVHVDAQQPQPTEPQQLQP